MNNPPAKKSDAEGPVRIACVGASITFGLGLPNRRAECYPAVLQSLLEANRPGRAKVKNFGYSGATAGRETNEPYWQTPSFTSATRFAPQVAVLAFGTNDAQHANLPNLPRFGKDLAALVEHFRTLPEPATVLLVSPPPVFDHPEIDGRVLDEVIRPTVSEIGAAERIGVVDAHTPFVNQRDWFPDRLHPTPEAARRLALLVFEAIEQTGMIRPPG